MYEHYWGLTSKPFANRVSDHNFYESPLHEEALARMFYCIEQDKALAVLHGPAGCGKSQLLHVLAQQVRRTQRFFVTANLGNLSEADFLEQIENQLRLPTNSGESVANRWRRLSDFLKSTHDAGLPTIFVLDGLDQAEASCVQAVLRLVQLHNQQLAQLTVIASIDTGRISADLTALLELADMGIELKPLERPETESYVRKRLETSGNRRVVFQPDAIDQLQQLTRGIPREINRLCDLALLAGMNESRKSIDRELINGLSQERQLPVA